MITTEPGLVADECLEHEKLLVGSVMKFPDAVDAVAGSVSGDCFLDEPLGKVFDLLVSLRDMQVPFNDPAILVAELKSANLLKAIGGHAGIGELVINVPHGGNAAYHAKEIKERFRTREFQRIGEQLAWRAGRGLDAETLSSWLRKEAARIESPEKSLTTITASAAAGLDDYLARLRQGQGDALWELPEPLGGYEIGPGLISVLGAPPGFGKTTLATQIGMGVLKCNPDTRLVFANAEVTFDVLLRRELTRLAGVPSKRLRFADLETSDWIRIDRATSELRPLLERCEVMQQPFTFDRIAALEDQQPGLLIVDYLQKFAPAGEIRQGVGSVMSTLRLLAMAGWGILALSATARTQGKGGSGHDSSKLTLASFRESGEIEFQADSCYILQDKGPHDGQEFIRGTELACVKNRHGERNSFDLVYDMPGSSFDAIAPDVVEWNPDDDPFADDAGCDL